MDWLRAEKRPHPSWLRYGAAILFVLLASLLSVALRHWLAPAPLATFIAAVALSAWFGGVGPAVVAIALSLAPISLVALEPFGVWWLSGAERSALVIFVLVSALLVLLSASRDRAAAAAGRARARSEALADATQALTEAGLDLDAVVVAIAREAAVHVGDLAVVRLLSEDGVWLNPLAVDHPNPVAARAAGSSLAIERHRADQGANGAALREGRPQRLDSIALVAQREADPDLWPPLSDAPTAVLLAVPLRANGRGIGTLSVSRAHADRAYDAEDERFLQELADRAALAIERTRLFAQVHANEERLRLAVEANRMVAWEWDPATDRITTSASFAEVYGLPALEGIAGGMALVWPEDLSAHQEKVNRVAHEGGEYQSVFRITRPADGEMVWLEERAKALKDKSNGVTRVLGVATDVTARLRAEALLRESEARLGSLLEQLPVGIGLADNQGRWLLRNPIMMTYVGDTIPSRDPEIRPRWQAWDEQGRTIEPSWWPAARALRGEAVPGMDFLFTGETEAEKWTRVSAAPFRNAAGEVIGAVNVIQDIDARRRAEDALATSESRARFLADSSALLATTLDYDEAVEHVVRLAVPSLADWCVVDLVGPNGALHRLAIVHGDPQRAAVAEDLRQRYPALPPDVEHTAWKVLRSGEPWVDSEVAQSRFIAQARDETHLSLLRQLGFVSELVVPLVARGRAMGVLTLVQGDSGRRFGAEDVAFAEELARHCALAIDNARLYREARDAEAKIRRLFDAGVIGLLVADPEGIVEANDAFLSMVGYTREDLAAGRLHWTALTPPEYDHLDARAIAEIAERGVCTPFEKEYVRKDGSRAPILIGAASLQGTAPPWICGVLDLSAQKAADQDRVAFIDAATHDLKNPLTSLKGRVQLLLRRVQRGQGLEPDSLAAGLAAIDADASRMVTLIDELMDAAHLRTGQPLTLHLTATDLIELVQDGVADVPRRAAHTFAVDYAVPTLVGPWDRPRLERVVQNLLDNAIKYSPADGEIALRVTCDVDHEGAAWAVLTVRDEGVGIPTEDLPHIFQRFRRGGNVSGIPGAGIGLAGARQIVEQHGGTITVESTEDKGSTFTVRLPLGSR